MPELVEVPLVGGRGDGLVALIDAADYALVSERRWYAHVMRHTTYAHNPHFPPFTYMHMLIMGAKGIDHKNGDGLDNRKDNLREASQLQNMRNKLSIIGTSVYKGVSWDNTRNKWRVYIKPVTGKQKYLGRFDTELEAALVYDAAAVRYFGEYARLNFPLGGPDE